MYSQNEKFDLIIEELHNIAEEMHNMAVELNNYNRIGTELLEMQRRMFTPMEYERPYNPFENRNSSFDNRDFRYR